eukprot:TRINITY_DN21924_c0_g1_i1.p1 TRINITY_DN21924_c0_g1~~TRINITY_DN21924_c0_g1_i1.p1  ORF type:complete len:408 (-),score=34.83 TRINITY_DN21924_c0_g1_i1:443-1588(-)
MKVARGTVIYAFYAHVCFGASNWLIGYMNSAMVQEWVLVGLLWCTGVVGLVPAVYFLWKKGTIFFKMAGKSNSVKNTVAVDEASVDAKKCAVNVDDSSADVEKGVAPEISLDKGVAAELSLDRQSSQKGLVPTAAEKPKQVQSLKVWVKLVVISTGVLHALGEYFMKEAFAAAPSEIGPLSAFVSSEALVVAVCSHFVYREYMNFRQCLCLMGIAIGLSIIGVGSAHSEGLVDADLTQKLRAFSFATAGMLSFAGAVLGMRTSCRQGVALWSGVVVRFVVEFLMGIAAIVASFINHGLPDIEVEAMVWMCPILAGLLQAVGMVFANKALTYPNTGIANAIYSSNSIVVLLLGVLVDNLYPSPTSLLGMGFVVAAVTGISLS